MKPESIFAVAVALLAAAPGIGAAADAPHAKGAASVADMLQQKREQNLRRQLATEGRWSEIQQLDEDLARGAQKEQEERLKKVNAQLARGAHGGGPANDSLSQCEFGKFRDDNLRTVPPVPARTAVR